MKVEDASDQAATVATESRDVASTQRPRPALRKHLTQALLGPARLAPLVVALAAMWTFFTIQSPIFLSSRNLTNLTNQIAVSTLVALALTFLLIVRQIDISLAALSAVAGGIAADLSVEAHWNTVLAVAIALASGLAVGAIQAAIVTIFKAPAFIVTLGGMFIMEAVLLWLLPVTQVVPLADTPLQSIAGDYTPDWLSYVLGAAVILVYGALRWSDHRARRAVELPTNFVRRALIPTAVLACFVFGLLVFVFNAYLGVPIPAVIVLGCCLAYVYVAHQTPLGRHLYALGGNPEAARRAGIHVGRITIIVFAAGGVLAALSGIVQASRLLGVSAQSDDLTLLLGALAAVVIGGVSLFGGRGSVWGAVLGGILIGSIQNGLDLINSSTQVQWSVEGAVLIIAVVIDAMISRASPVSSGAGNQ